MLASSKDMITTWILESPSLIRTKQTPAYGTNMFN